MKKTLGVTFTKGISLQKWYDTGLLGREKLIYEEHLRKGRFEKIYWFTYGCEDKKLRDRLVCEGKLDERIEIVPCPWYGEFFGLRLIYSARMHNVHKDICKEIDVIKTNQMEGAWAAGEIAKRYQIPLLLRTGYTYSSLIKNSNVHTIYSRLKRSIQYKFYMQVEKSLYQQCDLAEVSSIHDQRYICRTCNLSGDKVRLLVNYIDCSLFYPTDNERISDRLLFVGRLHEVKNLHTVIMAVRNCNVGLDIYGAGDLKEGLEQYARQVGADVQFMGTCPNEELPRIYRKYRYFILASLYEGMPKTLLEAMACGCVCLGTNVDGIEEVLEDHVTGFVASNVSEAVVTETLREMIAYENWRLISENAALFIQKEFSLEGVADKEWENISQILEDKC